MFRFDNFRKPSVGTSQENATQSIGGDPLTSFSSDDSNDNSNSNNSNNSNNGNNNNNNSNSNNIGGNKSPSFLQRIASSETIFRPTPNKRPSASSLHKSSSSSALQSSSFSIPIPSNSWGMKTLSQLQDSGNNEYDDIINLLLDGDKAVLLLPVSRPTHPSVHIDLEFIKDHVIIYPPHQDKSQVMSLSGIRGVFQKDQFVALELSSSDYDITFSMAKANEKKSLFDTFDLDPSSIAPNHPVCNILATHVPVKIRNEKIIKAMLIQKPLSKSDVMDWMQNRSSSRSNGTKTTTLIPPTAIIPSSPLDDPLANTINTFLAAYRHRPPKTITLASEQWADFLDDLRDSMDSSGAGKSADDRMDAIESYMCRELYDKLFIAGSGNDSIEDEVLESRIAALNLLDLNLGHLGVVVDPVETEGIAKMVNAAGTQLQQLNSIPGAKEKLDILVKTHQIIVDTIEKFADKQKETSIDLDLEVVQEMKQAMSIVNDDTVKNTNQEGSEAKIQSRRTSNTNNLINDDDNTNTTTQQEVKQMDTQNEVDSNPTLSDRETDIKNHTQQNRDDMGDESIKIEPHDATAAMDGSTSTPPCNTEEGTKDDTETSAPVPPFEQTNLATASADVLLPLLIFTIVKSNPTNFLSNLKFIQRFRHPGQLTGQANYCLTNILAAVSFLETTNLIGLGLSADRVHSNVTDLNALVPASTTTNQSVHSGQTTTGGAGLKLVSEVMDSSYRVFDGIGRFWQQRNGSEVDGSMTVAATAATASPSSSSTQSSTLDNTQGSNKTHHGISSLSPSELKDMASSAMGLTKSKRDSTSTSTSSQREGNPWENAVPGFLEHRKSSVKPSRSTSTSSSSSKTDHFQAILQAPSQFIQSVQQKTNNRHQQQYDHLTYDEPIQKFLNMKTVDELKIGEIAELLADYKRLAAILKQSNVL